jgi:hypothetical protein
MTRQRPNSGSTKDRRMRCDPWRVGNDWSEVGSGGGADMVESSKVNRGSGGKSSWLLVMRVARVEGMKTT